MSALSKGENLLKVNGHCKKHVSDFVVMGRHCLCVSSSRAVVLRKVLRTFPSKLSERNIAPLAICGVYLLPSTACPVALLCF